MDYSKGSIRGLLDPNISSLASRVVESTLLTVSR